MHGWQSESTDGSKGGWRFESLSLSIDVYIYISLSLSLSLSLTLSLYHLL